MTPEEFLRNRLDELADQLIKLAHELAATTKMLTSWNQLEEVKRKPLKQQPTLLFPGVLRIEMERAGVSFRELAKRTGLSAGYLNRVASGLRSPSGLAVMKIRSALDIG